MSITLQLSDIGIILDLIAVILLAKYSVPTNTLSPDGSETLSIGMDEITIALNKDKYLRYKKVTMFAYFILGVGFVLQLQLWQ
ncbi:hypothetical protein A6E12_08290 [Aliivibrio fischeri]|uniref:hypothetical protein n=1 Tax=Aliivibrio fischeri TaxID=668 RepID=UPI00080E3BB1|nr:hypothetical protein [Aliivibrio fischeri]OCH29005.1 hypothetical protein A6E12_08290 [Aliivibrio fischeri]